MDYLRPPTLTRLEETELRQFVLGVADGQVFTSAHFRNNDFTQVGMVVFIPLIGADLGAKVGVDIPDPPPRVKPPAEFVPLNIPDQPKPPPDYLVEPALKEVSAKHLSELEFRIRWGRVQPEAIDDYKADIAAENIEIIKEYEERLAAWREENGGTMANWKYTCGNIEEENKRRKAEHAKTVAAYETENAEQAAAYAEWETLADRWRLEFIQQIGVVWEWMEKAGPRSVNGYPTFFSCRFLHREDWERAKRAINREQDRRKDIEV